MTPEGKVKAAVKKILNAFTPVWYYMPVQGSYGQGGIPDFICCVAGKFLAIECKAGTNKTTMLQTITIGNIREAKGQALVINEADVTLVVTYLQMMGATPK